MLAGGKRDLALSVVGACYGYMPTIGNLCTFRTNSGELIRLCLFTHAARQCSLSASAPRPAADVKPWEHGPLSPRSAGPGTMRDLLFEMMTAPEVKLWRRFARAWQRHHDAEMGVYAAAEEANARADRRRLKSSPAP